MMSGAGTTTSTTAVTTWVALELNKKLVGTATKVHGVTSSADVDDVRALVKITFSNHLAPFDTSDIQLFCKRELGARDDPPRQHVVGSVLIETSPLLFEVESRLGAFPATLHLLAVAECA